MRSLPEPAEGGMSVPFREVNRELSGLRMAQEGWLNASGSDRTCQGESEHNRTSGHSAEEPKDDGSAKATKENARHRSIGDLVEVKG